MAASTEYALTPLQLRLWAGQSMHPGKPLYNMAMAFHILGPIDCSAFRAAFEDLVLETDALRMVLVFAGDAPLQRVSNATPPELDFVDFRDHAQPEETASHLIAKRCETAFDLGQRSWDSILIRTADEAFIWYFNQHHLFTDASSFAAIFRRLDQLYRAAIAGGVSIGEPLASFAEHVSRPAGAAQGGGGWLSCPCGTPPQLYGHSRIVSSTEASRIPLALSQAGRTILDQRIKEVGWATLSRQMTQFGMLATVLFSYLYRVSGQSALSIGVPVHNRATPKERNLAGLLIDVLPIGIEIDPGDTFRALYEKVRIATTAFLRDSTEAPTDASLHSSFNAVLNVITAQMGSFAGLDTRAEWIHTGHCDSGHILRLQAEDFDGTGAFRLHLDLNSEVFAEPEIVLGHFDAMLEAFLVDPDRAIDAVDILTPVERDRIAAMSRGPDLPAETRTVFEMIREQSLGNPSETAFVWGQSRTTYGDLENAVVALGAKLQASGVKRGDRVAISLPRTPAAVVAMIAAMRCGAAYVPIDPSALPRRQTFLVDDAGCSAVIVSPATVIADAKATAVIVDDMGLPLDRAEGDFTPAAVSGEDLAYILYTSGSTGTPKGVVVTHAALSHYVGWARDTYCGSTKLAFPLFSPLTFDLTVTSLFVPLISGGSINVYAEPPSGPDLAILDVLSENAVDIIKLTPSHLRMLLGRNLKESRVRQLIVGGEDLTADLAHRIHEAFGGRIAIHNEYGPTEATVGCILHTFDPQSDLFRSVPIGRPISNMGVEILNGGGMPQPIGTDGELCLFGAGIARGYHNRPELTSTAFLPADGDAPARYKTGDVARFRRDGTIEYLGRIDDQIKFNGVRIEASEVEAALTAVPGVETACVVLRHSSAPESDPSRCQACGLPSNFPGVSFDSEGVCSVCREFARYRGSAQTYFQDMPALEGLMATGLPSAGSHDCVVLFSGGKDSTYMLGRLADLGLRILAFTLDNGFISKQAKANIDRVVAALGVDHVYAEAPAMNEIFADSLGRFSNVCNGCFKAIYTLSMKIAYERQIPFVFTGLSRGQFFETRLSSEVFAEGAPSAGDIDAIVLEARKRYHRSQDAVSRCLDVSAFETDEIFEKVRIVDFYRYCDVGLDELYAYLDRHLPWVRPSDTGRSTNCRINDVGIYVHKMERGFHNYALPYSWDVRMGHKRRDEALRELNDQIDEAEVQRILAQIGYRPKTPEPPKPHLVAYYTGPASFTEKELRAEIATRLEPHKIPSRFVRLAILPLSRNGKVDRVGLPVPPERHEAAGHSEHPRTDAERRMALVWEAVLGTAPIGLKDNFFDLGGDSISAVRITTRALQQGFNLCPSDIFDAQTVERLVAIAENRGTVRGATAAVGPVPLTPAQVWRLGRRGRGLHADCDIRRFEVSRAVDATAFQAALRSLAAHHDALRTRFERRGDDWDDWRAEIVPDCDIADISVFQGDPGQVLCDHLCSLIDPESARNVSAAIVATGGQTEIVVAVHRMVADASSWSILLADLSALLTGMPLPPKTSSLRDRVDALQARAKADLPRWRDYLSGSSHALSFLPAADADTTTFARIRLAKNDVAIARERLRAAGATFETGIVAVLSCVLAKAGGRGKLAILVNSPCRESGDGLPEIDRTVGSFSAFVPLVVQLERSDDPARLISGILQSQAARPKEASAAGFLVATGRLYDATAQVCVNVIDTGGAGGSLLRTFGPLLRAHDPDMRTFCRLGVEVHLDREGATIDWSFTGSQSTVEAFADDFNGAFSGLLAAQPWTPEARSRRATGRANIMKLAAHLGNSGSAK